MAPNSSVISASVIIPAYTLERWNLLCDAVASVKAQTRPPIELILCIDHNLELFNRCVETWRMDSSSPFLIEVIANRFVQEEGSHVHVKSSWLKSPLWCRVGA